MSVPYIVQYGAGTAIGSAIATISANYPTTDLQAGDYWLLHCLYRNTVSTCNPPPGWTTLYGPDNITTVGRSWLFGTHATGSETGSVLIGITGSNAAHTKITRLYRLRDVPTSGYGGAAATLSASVGSQGVPHLGCQSDTLALAVISITDDNTIGQIDGESGGDFVWGTRYTTTVGADGAIALQYATMSSEGTISGGTYGVNASDPNHIRVFGLRGTPTVIESLSSQMKTDSYGVYGLINAIGLISSFYSTDYGLYNPSVTRSLSTVKRTTSELIGILEALSATTEARIYWIEFETPPGVEEGAITEDLTSVMRTLSYLNAQLSVTKSAISTMRSTHNGRFNLRKDSYLQMYTQNNANTIFNLYKTNGLKFIASDSTNSVFSLGRIVGFQTAKATNDYVAMSARVDRIIASVMETLTNVNASLTTGALSVLSTLMKSSSDVRTALQLTNSIESALSTASMMTSSPIVAKALRSAMASNTDAKTILQIQGQILEYLVSNIQTNTQVIANPSVQRELEELIKSTSNSAIHLILTNALKATVSSSTFMAGSLSVSAAAELQSLMKTVSNALTSPNVERSVRSVMRELSASSVSSEVQRLLTSVLNGVSNAYANLTVTAAGYVPIYAVVRTLTQEVIRPAVSRALSMASEIHSNMHALVGLTRALSVYLPTDSEAIFNLYSTKELEAILRTTSASRIALTKGGLIFSSREQTRATLELSVSKALSGLFQELSSSYGILSTQRPLSSLMYSNSNMFARIRFLSEQLGFGNVGKKFYIQDYARKFVSEDIDRKFILEDLGIRF